MHPRRVNRQVVGLLVLHVLEAERCLVVYELQERDLPGSAVMFLHRAYVARTYASTDTSPSRSHPAGSALVWICA